MLRGRRRLPLLAEISRPAPGGRRVWALRRRELEGLHELLPRLAGAQALLVAGEPGPSLVAAIGLASAAASAGRTTVLLECELARPRLAAELGLQPQPGLHEYLRWEARPEDIVQPLLLAGPAAAGAEGPLACVCAGRPAVNLETLLGLASFEHAVAKMRSAYQLVVLLSPFFAEHPDAAAVAARQADAVLLGFSATGKPRGPDRLLRSAIRRLPAPALGAIAVEGV